MENSQALLAQQAFSNQQMLEEDFFSKEDLTQINLELLPGLITSLRQNSSKGEKLDCQLLDSISKWVIDGWHFILDHSDELGQDPISPTVSNYSIIRIATAWARFIRDLTGSIKQFQETLQPSINYIVKTLWTTSAALKLNHPDFQYFNKASIQALSNLITLNTVSIQFLWPLLVNCEEEKSILIRLLYTQSNALLFAIAVLVLNTVHGDPQTIASLINNPVGKKAMTMLLERLDGLLDDETEVVFEVIVNLVRAIVKIEPILQVPNFYNSQATPSQVLSPAQLSILKILESSNLPAWPFSFLLSEFQKLSTSFEQNWHGFVLFTQIICKSIENIQSNSSDANDGIISDTEACGAVKTSLCVIKQLEKEKSEINATGQSRDHKVKSINQILIGLVKLLTCLLDLKRSGAKLIQDLIRNLGGIPIILNFTKFDVDFPYLSEHSIFLIKYLLKDNLENQSFVKRLQPIA